MYFKKQSNKLFNFTIATAVAVAPTFSLVGCSGQSDTYETKPVVELKGAQCLGAVPDKVTHFFEGSATADETGALWDCFSYALGTFSKYVQGDDSTEYHGVVLRDFLESYFLQNSVKGPDGHVISDNLLNEFMQLKSVFLGGSNLQLTKAEVARTMNLVTNLKGISLELLPHTAVIFGQQTKTSPPANDKADAALQAFDTAARKLVTLINPDRTNYAFSDIQGLFKEIYLYVKLQNPKSSLSDFSIYVPLLAQFKAMLLNSDATVIKPGEWVNLAEVASQAFGLTIRKDFYLSAQSLYTPNDLDELKTLIFGLTGVLRDAGAKRANGSVPLADINLVITEAAKVNVLPTGFTEDNTKNFVARLLDYVLNPQNVYPASGISSDKIAYVENEISNWITVQKALITKDQLPSSPAWVEMQGVLDGPWPLRVDNFSRLIFDGRKDVMANLESSSRMNWARELFHILFNAYILDPNRRVNTRQMSRSELHTVFEDLKPALVAFNLVNASDDTFDLRLFRDANLFMPRSDGNDYLGFYELIEYLHYVFSGIDAGDVLLNNAQTSCNLANQMFDETCFRKDMQTKFETLMAHLPGFRDYSGSVGPKTWNNNINYIERAVRDKGATGPMSHTDVYESFILLQYIETLMLRYDTDRSGTIDFIEALHMLKLFINVIAEALHLDRNTQQEEIQNAFIYILRYGELPKLDDPLTQIRMENVRLKKDHGLLTVDRGTILHIIAILSEMSF